MEWVKVLIIGLHGLVSGVDGDTVRLWDDSLVRLKGFNTPEVHSRCVTAEGKLHERLAALKAQARLRELLKSKKVALIILPEQCGHGRMCGIVMADDKDVRETMIEEGLAEPMDCPDGKCPPPRDWCQ